jgi:dihydroneopterin aldolase
MVKDYILVEGLVVKASIGVYEWEQKIEQTLVVDLSVETSFQQAAADDNIDETISYAWLAEQLSLRIQATHYALLETLINELSDWLKVLKGVVGFELTLRKPGAVANTESVGVRRVFNRH